MKRKEKLIQVNKEWIDEKPENLITDLTISNGWICHTTNSNPRFLKTTNTLLDHLRISNIANESNLSQKDDLSPTDLTALPYVQDLNDKILKAINDTLKMSNKLNIYKKEADMNKNHKHNSSKRAERHHIRRKQGKTMFLEKQQQELMRRKEMNLIMANDETNTGSILQEDTKKEPVKVDNGDTLDTDTGGGDIKQENENFPSGVTEMALNSMRVIIQVIHPMLKHQSSRDNTLEMKLGPAIKQGQKKKAQIFMFSCQAYSITTVKCFNIIQREFDRIVDSLNGEVFEKISQGNLTKLDQMIPTILKSRHTDSTGSIIRHSSIFMNQNIPNYNKIVETAQFFDREVIASLSNQREELRKSHKATVSNLCNTLAKTLDKRYNNGKLTVYGSCLNDLNLGKSSDVDISIFIPALAIIRQQFEKGIMKANEYERNMKESVYGVLRAIERNSRYGSCFYDMVPVTRARIPVVKGKFSSKNGPVAFDICFLNDIAVVNSTLIQEYSMIDTRVKFVMLLVKWWAKEKDLCSTIDGTLSSYTWMNLVSVKKDLIKYPCKDTILTTISLEPASDLT